MPGYFWFSQAANIIAIILCVAALLIILWLSRRQWVNLSYALFLTGNIAWLGGTVLCRLMLAWPEIVPGSPQLLLEISAAGYGLVGAALLWFITAFYHLRARAVRLLNWIALPFVVGGIILALNGYAVGTPFLHDDGGLWYAIYPIGYVLGITPLLYVTIVVGLVLQRRNWRENWFMQIGAAMVLVASVGTLIDTTIPLQVLGMVLATLFLTYGVFKEQIFNPLVAANQHLEAEVALRTEALEISLREQHRVQGELDIAHTIQSNLLPEHPPEHPRMVLAAHSTPAREVGGDFFTHNLLSQRYLSIAVGDVSGKGIPAALLTALIINMFDSLASLHLNQGDLLNDLNRMLYLQLKRSRLHAGLCSILIDLETLQLQSANAGLISPVIWRAGTVEYLDIGGLPLGTQSDTTYKQIQQYLQPGDRILVFSDGLIEAMNGRGELWGFERFEALIAAQGHLEPKALVQTLLTEVGAFTHNVPIHDDITIVVIAIT